jgi:hypothetical protein
MKINKDIVWYLLDNGFNSYNKINGGYVHCDKPRDISSITYKICVFFKVIKKLYMDYQRKVKTNDFISTL